MSEMSGPIRYWNRSRNRMETERVYGDVWMRRIYGTKPGQSLANAVLSRKLPSRVFGAYYSSRSSAKKIWPFVEDFQIPMNEFEDVRYRSFNEFFIRRFKPGLRVFEPKPELLPAPCEARYFAYPSVSPEQLFPVKGKYLTPQLLLGDERKAEAFRDGPLLLARLCPVDYHRFHFPDDGRVLESYRVPGKLHSVNPVALKFRGDIFATNERQVSLLQTRGFGRLAYIEVGALCVGKIVQSWVKPEFARGEEKGYFLFGASTVIVLGEKGAWTPDADLVEKTQEGIETWVKLGERIASASQRR